MVRSAGEKSRKEMKLTDELVLFMFKLIRDSTWQLLGMNPCHARPD